MEIKKHIVPLFFLVFLGLFAMKTLRGPDFYDGHDAQAHIVRLYQYDRAFKDGQIPPRWAGGLLGKRGYPVFIFVYPLPYAISEGFHYLGLNLAQSLKLTFAGAYLISAIAMYFLLLNIGNPAGQDFYQLFCGRGHRQFLKKYLLPLL